MQTAAEKKLFIIEQHAGSTVITPLCELDFGVREALRSVLEEAARRTRGKLVFSLLQCEYADSTALDALAAVYSEIGNRLALVLDPRAGVSRLFELSNFGEFMAIYPTVEAALEPANGGTSGRWF